MRERERQRGGVYLFGLLFSKHDTWLCKRTRADRVGGNHRLHISSLPILLCAGSTLCNIKNNYKEETIKRKQIRKIR